MELEGLRAEHDDEEMQEDGKNQEVGNYLVRFQDRCLLLKLRPNMTVEEVRNVIGAKVGRSLEGCKFWMNGTDCSSTGRILAPVSSTLVVTDERGSRIASGLARNDTTLIYDTTATEDYTVQTMQGYFRILIAFNVVFVTISFALMADLASREEILLGMNIVYMFFIVILPFINGLVRVRDWLIIKSIGNSGEKLSLLLQMSGVFRATFTMQIIAFVIAIILLWMTKNAVSSSILLPEAIIAICFGFIFSRAIEWYNDKLLEGLRPKDL